MGEAAPPKCSRVVPSAAPASRGGGLPRLRVGLMLRPACWSEKCVMLAFKYFETRHSARATTHARRTFFTRSLNHLDILFGNAGGRGGVVAVAAASVSSIRVAVKHVARRRGMAVRHGAWHGILCPVAKTAAAASHVTSNATGSSCVSALQNVPDSWRSHGRLALCVFLSRPRRVVAMDSAQRFQQRDFVALKT